MKKFSSFLSIILLMLALQLPSCKGLGNSPVDQYISILDKASEQINNATSYEDISNIQALMEKDGVPELLQNAKDYELTDSDKDKIKKASDKLLKVIYEKSWELTNLPDELKEATKSQMNLAIEAANLHIDNAKTLGELTRTMN